MLLIKFAKYQDTKSNKASERREHIKLFKKIILVIQVMMIQNHRFTELQDVTRQQKMQIILRINYYLP